MKRPPPRLINKAHGLDITVLNSYIRVIVIKTSTSQYMHTGLSGKSCGRCLVKDSVLLKI